MRLLLAQLAVETRQQRLRRSRRLCPTDLKSESVAIETLGGQVYRDKLPPELPKSVSVYVPRERDSYKDWIC